MSILYEDWAPTSLPAKSNKGWASSCIIHESWIAANFKVHLTHHTSISLIGITFQGADFIYLRDTTSGDVLYYGVRTEFLQEIG